MKLSSVLSLIENTGKHTFTYDGHVISKNHVILDGSLADTDTKWFVAGFEFGVSWLIAVPAYRGDGFEAAWGAWVDSLPAIPVEELPEAYGPEGTPDGSFLDMAFAAARETSPGYGSAAWDAHIAAIEAHAKRMLESYTDENPDKYPDLIEGYENQDNSSGTGVVSMGHYAHMSEADLDLIEVSEEVCS